ncbi:hypothetical protein [Halomonas sp. NO4]|nr:hypothetical protein [Halomonas sp. NO4]
MPILIVEQRFALGKTVRQRIWTDAAQRARLDRAQFANDDPTARPW